MAREQLDGAKLCFRVIYMCERVTQLSQTFVIMETTKVKTPQQHVIKQEAFAQF